MNVSEESGAGSSLPSRGANADADLAEPQPATGRAQVSERLLPPRSSDGSNPSGPIGLGLAIGLAAGTLFGLVMGQLVIGIAIGIGMGIAMGTAFTMAAGSE